MITPVEALNLLTNLPIQKKIIKLPLENAQGSFLAERIVLDRDYPPFHRSSVDGYAWKKQKTEHSPYRRIVQGQSYAGEFKNMISDQAKAWKVATGAPVPDHYEQVNKQEEVEFITQNEILLGSVRLSDGKNIAKKGSEGEKGDLALQVGDYLDTIAIGILASLGISHVQVFQKPKIGVFSTGDELITINEPPEQYQIRDSNGVYLHTACLPWASEVHYYGIARDNPIALQKIIEIASANDVILASGGVSVGERDYLVKVLTENKVKPIFHTIAQKPGKPFYFGNSFAKYFACLPGNPASVRINFTYYVMPFLIHLSGAAPWAATQLVQPLYMPLAEVYNNQTTLTHLIPCQLITQGELTRIKPILLSSSGNQLALHSTQGFFEVGPNTDRQVGDSVAYRLWC